MGIKHVEWLNNWRDTRVFEANNELASLPSLMSSLRAIAGNRIQQPTVALAASFPTSAVWTRKPTVQSADTDTRANFVTDFIPNLHQVRKLSRRVTQSKV
ncbi:unnamed protein product [Trifolium pratense]|uniref:Uncharacterized protein n=1 Tax=Trifolium pratense TaxID=57577 RepID=A0ACB0JJ70_TRIPR|nr:unnamed protein product [Trifolium pratense]